MGEIINLAQRDLRVLKVEKILRGMVVLNLIQDTMPFLLSYPAFHSLKWNTTNKPMYVTKTVKGGNK